MSKLDLGEYKKDYLNIFPIRKVYGYRQIKDDSIVKIYEAEKKMN